MKLYLELKLLFKVYNFMMIQATLIQNLFPTGTHIFSQVMYRVVNKQTKEKPKPKQKQPPQKNTLDLKSEAQIKILVIISSN